MKFGPLAIDQALGGVLAHAISRPGLSLRKGERIGAEQIAALRNAGVDEIVVAIAEEGDVEENPAAWSVAQVLAGDHLKLEAPFTGRCNLIAGCGGVLLVDAEAINQINAVDESVTVATLAPMSRIAAGETAATVKIIPFAILKSTLECAMSGAANADPCQKPLRIAPFLPLRIGVVSTLLPGLKPSIVEKTLQTFAARLDGTGARLAVEERAQHEAGALAGALKRIAPASDLIVIFGASAIADRRDVIPAAIEVNGGRILHFGMPVDPGNLLLIGALPGVPQKPVIGAPGCARSPKENGFDMVLHRLLAGLDVASADIRRMGVGGLLSEIKMRPQPRRPAHD